MATNSSQLLKDGLQVMVLTPSGALDTAATKPVTLSLVEEADSTGIPWNRSPKLNGIASVVPVMGVASFGELGISTSGLFRFQACMDDVCTKSPVILVVPNVERAVILAQPPKDAEFSLFNPKTSKADFSNSTGPINVTFTDNFDNYGVQSTIFKNGIMEANITCQLSTDSAPDSETFNPETAKLVQSVEAIWTPTGYAEFWSFGKLSEGIDDAFGPGTVAGALDGFRCWADVGMGEGFRGGRTKSTTTQYWIFK